VPLVRCRDCFHFIPDKIGFGQGIGKCKLYEEYKAKNPGPSALSEALRKLGNRPDYDGDLFWGGELIDRNCEKYEAKDER
jgi:hypothetical protein